MVPSSQVLMPESALAQVLLAGDSCSSTRHAGAGARSRTRQVCATTGTYISGIRTSRSHDAARSEPSDRSRYQKVRRSGRSSWNGTVRAAPWPPVPPIFVLD